MSEAKTENNVPAAPIKSLIEQYQEQLEQFRFQKQQAETNLNQLIGAIYACETMIKKFEDESLKKSTEEAGDEENVKTDNQEQEQAA